MAKRTDPRSGVKEQNNNVSKKKARNGEREGQGNGTRAPKDLLDLSLLTKKVWNELYAIFNLHFATEMSFLHPPTFRNMMHLAAYPRNLSTFSAELQDSRVLLLGVLTLTARFHPELVAYHSPSNDPIAASNCYATALAAAYTPTSGVIAKTSLEVVQALLMLGLYEWGQTRGLAAWVCVGTAIDLAQAMGLEYEDDPDIDSYQLRKVLSVTEREIRRRTLWSCFIMNHILTARKYRPSRMNSDTFSVRLPRSDHDFLFANDVKTQFLNSAFSGVPIRPGVKSTTLHANEILSIYVRLVEIFGRIAKWSHDGGGITEEHLLWKRRSQVLSLRLELEDFAKDLPLNLAFSRANLRAYTIQRNATLYTSMHTLYSLGLIMLYREHIPYIVFCCDGPQDLLNQPAFARDEYHAPGQHREKSVEQVFRASKDILDMVIACQETDTLPESPQIGYAIYQAAVFAVYARYFPQTDTIHLFINPESGQSVSKFQDKGYAATATRILKDLAPKLRIAEDYLRHIYSMRRYFMLIVQRNARVTTHPQSF